MNEVAVQTDPDTAVAFDDFVAARGSALWQPFECPSRGGPDQPMDTPADGTIDPGAVLVRVCAAQEGTPWIPPLDALTSDVDTITQAFNGLAVAEDRMPCTEEFGPAYLMVFQYPDGHAVQVRGDLYGCRLVSFGALERQGADEALSAYFDALQAQRVKTGPILDGEPLSCPDPSFSSVDTLMPVALEDPGLARVTVCRYSTDGALIRQGVLNEAEVSDVSADLASNTTTSSDLKLCPPEAGGSTELIVRTSYGDVVAFQPQCDYFVSFGSPDQFWQPTPATLELIESAVR